MRIIIIGSGGREHAIAWSIAESPLLEKLFITPGNPGTTALAETVALDIDNHDDVIAFCQMEKIDLVIIGPEAPLVAGLVDSLAKAGINSFGPHAAAAQLEGSKNLPGISMTDTLFRSQHGKALMLLMTPSAMRSNSQMDVWLKLMA